MKKDYSVEFFFGAFQVFMLTFKHLIFWDISKEVEWYELWFPSLILAFFYVLWGVILIAKWIKSVILYKEDEYDKWAKDLRKN